MAAHRDRYLFRRGNVFQFRMRLPTAVARRFKQRELKSSLKTSDMTEAKLRCRLLATAFEQLFDKLPVMPELSQDDLKKIAQDYFNHLLRADNEDLFEMREVHGFTDEEIKNFGERRTAQIETLAEKRPPTGADTRQWLDRFGHKAVGDHADSFSILQKYFSRARIEAYKIGRAKMIGDYAATVSSDPLYAGIINDTLMMPAELLGTKFRKSEINTAILANLGDPELIYLGNAIEKFSNRQIKRKKWSERTQGEYKKSLAWFLEIFGHDRLIDTISNSDFEEFQNMLLAMPKGSTMQVKSLKAALEDKKPDDVLIHPRSVNKYMTPIRSLFKWALNERLISFEPGKNAVIDFDEESTKRPFTLTEIEKIFSSPMFTGCKSEATRTKPGKYIFKNDYYWLFLLQAFTGARLSELVLLKVEDVMFEYDIWFLNIKPHELRRLKNKSARRAVPLHKFLIDQGFLEFVEGRKQEKPDQILFSGLKVKNISSAFSKRGNTYLDQIGINDPDVSLHSFRHSFTDGCRSAEVHEVHRIRMMGHKEAGMAGVYGIGPEIRAAAASINKIKWDFMKSFQKEPKGIKVVLR